MGNGETADSWNGKVESEAPPVVTLLPGRIAIADAMKVFLSNREGAKIAPADVTQITFAKQLTNFMEARGCVGAGRILSANPDGSDAYQRWVRFPPLRLSVWNLQFPRTSERDRPRLATRGFPDRADPSAP
jgi:hypothetical protein